MSRTLCYVIIGYLSGSILYARVFEKLFHKENMIEGSKDRNPGTANAFMRGGFWCGVLTLCCDMGKALYRCSFIIREKCRSWGWHWFWLHLQQDIYFPCFIREEAARVLRLPLAVCQGCSGYDSGAGVGSLLYILFTDITDYAAFYRTIGSYGVSFIMLCLMQEAFSVKLGFLLITIAVGIRFVLSKEEKDKIRVSLLWKR